MIGLTLRTASEAADHLRGKSLVSAEFMYQPRPTEPCYQRVFDFTLDSRLRELSQHPNSAVLFVCDSPETVAGLAHLPAAYPGLSLLAAIVNPVPLPLSPHDPYRDTPFRCGWHDPNHWRRYNLTDRWARIVFVLDVARQLTGNGWLVMPALDAVWGRGLLVKLLRLGQRYARNGLAAAVSPYTCHQHSPVPGVDIPQEIINALNAAFARDSLLRWRFRFGRYQAFWGKTGLLPFGMCGYVLEQAETMVWEDDLEIDRVIRAGGYRARTLWITRPSLYRQSPPVFDRAGLQAVIERNLHYSLNIPGAFYGEKSGFNQPLDWIGRLHRLVSPRFNRAVALSEAVIAGCNAAIAGRLNRYGMSWVDWGAYRYVVRVGDPLVQVWKYAPALI